MNLTIHPTFFSVVCICIVLGLGAYWCYTGYRRNPRKLTAWLEILRFVILTIICFLLLQPEWVQISHPTQPPNITFLCDRSESMQTQDAIIDNNDVVTRREALNQLLTHPSLSELKTKYNINIVDFSASSDNENTLAYSATDLSIPLESQLKGANNLKAVVLLSDGSHNTDTVPQQYAQRFKSRKIPLYTVPIGSESLIPDIELSEVKIPSYGIVHESIQIPFTIKNTFPVEQTCTIELKNNSDSALLEKTITIPPHSSLTESFIYPIKNEGLDQITIQVKELPEEKITNNNQVKGEIKGRKETIKVLVIDSLPRWEYRFIRNALYRDPGVDVQTLLFHPTLGIKGNGPGYIQNFPESLDKLSQYDVVFLGDVGIGEHGLTLDQASLLKGLVANQASGLIFLPGAQGNQSSLTQSDLNDLFPVFLNLESKGTLDPTPSPLTLTKDGQSSLLTLLTENEKDNIEVWKNLPGFYWYAPVKRAKAGSTVLATHANASNEFGRIPLLVTKAYGNGKILYMATDSAWRWRRGVEDLYHYKFWGQVARWMSYQRKMAAGENIKLMPSAEHPNVGDNLHLVAMASDKMGAPLSKGEVYLEITKPDGQVSSQQLTPLNGQWGSYSSHIKITSPGTWQFKAISSETPDKPTLLSITTGTENLEKLGQPINLALMEELSRIAQGKCTQAQDFDQLCKELTILPTPPPIEKRLLLWSNIYVLGLILLLLSAFWVGRKLNGTF